MANTDDKSQFEAIAVDGYESSNFFGKIDVIDEYQPELRGRRGRRTYRQMTNDETVGAMRFGIDAFFRGVEFYVDAPETDGIDEEQAEFYRKWCEDTLFNHLGDPNDPYKTITWDNTVINALTCIDFGWSYCDVPVYQKEDGTIGIDDLIFVAQETLDGWARDEKLDIVGLYQRAPTGLSHGRWSELIPRDRALHFIAAPHKGSPEGRSALRHVYRPWYYKSKYMAIEAIQMERGCGFPVLYIDAAVSKAAERGEEWATAIKSWAPDFVANIKRNSQSGAVLYSSPYKAVSENGGVSYSNMRTMELKLETPGNATSVDIDKAIKRCDTAIARSLLAGFLMLGNDGKGGSLALGQDQSNLFLKAISGWLEMFSSVINKQLIPMLWRLNGFPDEYMPVLRPGDLTQKTIEQVGAFVRDLAAAGIMVTDEETENFLRDFGGLPKRTDEGGDLPPIPTQDE